MPLYEYRCQKCGQTFEVMQKFSDAPLTVHDSCGGSVEKLLSTPAFHLKGTGWYATDYAKSGAKSATSDSSDSKSDSKSESKKESKPETKSDAKPAATSETK